MELWLPLFIYLSIFATAYGSPHIHKYQPQRVLKAPSLKDVYLKANDTGVQSLALTNDSNSKPENINNIWGDNTSSNEILYGTSDENFDLEAENIEYVEPENEDTITSKWQKEESTTITFINEFPESEEYTITTPNNINELPDTTTLSDLPDQIITTSSPEENYFIEIGVDPDFNSTAYDNNDTFIYTQTETPPSATEKSNTECDKLQRDCEQEKVVKPEPDYDIYDPQFFDSCGPPNKFQGEYQPFRGSPAAFNSNYGHVHEICNKFYFQSFYQVMFTWEEADAMCKSFNLTLLSFETVEEQKCMNQYFCDHIGHSFQFWTSGRDFSKVDEVIWTPNVVDIRISSIPQCVLVTFKDSDQNNLSFLSDDKCNSLQSFICE